MQPHNILRGILFMCAASAIFPIMNAMVKHLSAELPTAEIVWARNLSHLIFVTLLFAPKRGWRLAATQRLGGQILRSCLLLGSNIFYFTAMAYVPLAEASAISFISPFLVALIAAFILKEQVGLGHWIAIGVGFFIAFVFLVVGCFLDAIPAIIIVGTVLEPLAKSVEMHPVHFAIVSIVSLAFGLVTPPYGLCLMISCAVAGVPLRFALKDTMIMLVPMILVLAAMIVWPEIPLFLPRLIAPELLK